MLGCPPIYGENLPVTKPDPTPPSEIERVETPTREEFEENYVKRRRPVILTGVATGWKAFTEWTPEYLKSVAGDSVVTAHYDPNGDFQQWYDMADGVREDRQIEFAKLIDLLVAEPPDLRYYMTEHALHLWHLSARGLHSEQGPARVERALP